MCGRLRSFFLRRFCLERSLQGPASRVIIVVVLEDILPEETFGKDQASSGLSSRSSARLSKGTSRPSRSRNIGTW